MAKVFKSEIVLQVCFELLFDDVRWVKFEMRALDFATLLNMQLLTFLAIYCIDHI